MWKLCEAEKAVLEAVMNLKTLRKPTLLQLAKELRLDVSDSLRKPELIEAILALGADDDELSECVELIREREEAEGKAEAEKKEEEERKRRHDVEMRRLELEIIRSRAEGSEASGVAERVVFKMTDLMRSHKLGEDIGLFLVNFERTCERQGFSQETWPQRLLSLLPGEASEVIARLTKEDAADYSKVKSSLLKKYRLSAEGFRQKFRDAVKEKSESYPEFAYKLMANLGEWLKEAKAYGNHDRVIQCIGLEQFYRRLPESVRYWVQDRPDVNTVERAAELAEEFITRRALGASAEPRKEPKGRFERPKAPVFKREVPRVAPPPSNSEVDRAQYSEASAETQKRFETKKPRSCFKCHQTGHFAAECTKPKVVFLAMNESDDNMKLLEPYMYDLIVNGKQCRVLRDSAATMDVVHPSFVQSGQFSGDCAWIRQAVEPNSQCLPVAKVSITGAFGTLETEAAVSPHLPQQYPYLFSNKSDQMLRERGLTLGEGVVQALTRSKARELAAKATVEEATARQTKNQPSPELKVEGAVPRTKQSEVPVAQQKVPERVEDSPRALEETAKELLVTPISENLNRLLGVGTASLIAEQKGDQTLKKLQYISSEGVAKRNVKFKERGGILYRTYLDRRGVEFDQLVVPQAYRQDLLHLVHGSSWSGHLGVRKTKDRLLQEYYWPGCFRDVERFVQTCDVCQRVGKPGDKAKFSMKLVPVITEPFRRLVIDTVAPLPKDNLGLPSHSDSNLSGYKISGGSSAKRAKFCGDSERSFVRVRPCRISC